VHHLRRVLASLAVLLTSCASGATPHPASHTSDTAVPDTEEAAADPGEETAQASPLEEADDGARIPVWANGRQTGSVSRAEAHRRGLTVIELGDEWTPRVLQEDPSLAQRGRQPFRERFLRLANDEVERRPDDNERYLELYGIFPTFQVLRARLADEQRHVCHDGIDDALISTIDVAIRPGADIPRQRQRANAAIHLRNRLEEVAARRSLASIDELESDRTHGRDVRRLRQIGEEVGAIRAVQAHLRCEGSLSSRATEGVFDAWTGRALRVWQSKNMIIALAGRLDEVTRRSLAMDTRETEFLATLRALRERVVDASGLLEDGSASNSWSTVVDRQLELDDEYHWVSRLAPLPNGAPDLVNQATDATARALGWTDPAAATAWLNEHAASRQPSRLIAVDLPDPPAYHSAHMELRAEIDRGDVDYGLPYTADGRPRGFAQRNRPIMTIFTRHEGRDIPLVRWNTTIGGWQPEINPTDGTVGMRYKGSDVGPRVWRDIIASPAWLPPPNTPDDELLVRRSGGGWAPHRAIVGPGYDSAYGLALVVHHMVRGDGTDADDFVDRGIRSHGSVSYSSILRGFSHGCHRLFNHLAVRMTSFLLRHRNHTVQGRLNADWRRVLHPEGSEEEILMEVDTRGFGYQLTPPVPLEVLEGNIRGRQTRPLGGFYPLPETVQEQARAELEAQNSAGSAVPVPQPPPPQPPAPR
jgi:hypothetical protein